METGLNPNKVSGLASGMDTKGIIDKLIAAEQKKIDPVVSRREEKIQELDTWKQVKAHLEAVKETSTVLAKKSLWEGKLVTSSNPEIIEAIATSGAKPGKHTIVVDKLALNHQIASQSFKEKEVQIGRGQVSLLIGNDQEEKIVIDETNDTLQGFVDAINALEGDASANIIKTGNKEKPYQIVLTSKKTGLEGEIKIKVNLEGEGESPTFDPYYLQPGKWKGLAPVAGEPDPKPTGTGASTAIPELTGTYTGEEPIDLTFTVVNTGIIGVSENLKIRWEDDQGRFGYLDLGKFNYTPGEEIAVVDGINLVISDGEIIVNDTFVAKAKNQESELFWWKDDADRAAKISQPSSWGRQATEGGPVITGNFTGEEDDTFRLTVVGSGQIGQADNLRIDYVSENGVEGSVFVGAGYEPGTKLSLGKGLELSLKPGLLQEGAYSTFSYQAESTADYWWLDSDERHDGGSVKDVTNWITPEVEEEDEFAPSTRTGQKSQGDRVSNVEKRIIGQYTSFEPKVYTFKVVNSGGIGITKDLELSWVDNKGNEGTLAVGDGYIAGTPIEFDSGLSLVLSSGNIFESDSFSFRTFSPVIQPPQDAEIRFGATETGGGLVITSPTNTLEDVIDGVKLDLIKTSDEPVIISIRGDTEKALAGIKEFTDAYNAMLLFFRESTKYDQESGIAGPLQGDRNLPRIQNETSRIFIDKVVGLETDRNLLYSIGLKINSDGLIDVDEEKLKNSILDNLSTVSNLFRSFGTTENTGVVYISSTEKTKVSGIDGFNIDVSASATNGMYQTPPNTGVVTLTDDNNKIFVTVNGKDSEEISLEKGTFSLDEITKDLRKKIIEDKQIGKLRTNVTFQNGQITIRSHLAGKRSSISIRASNATFAANHPLMNGTSKVGTDVEGSIDGEPMVGSGHILTGAEGTAYEGLKIYVSLTESQLNDGAEAQMIFTKGVGTKVMEYIDKLLESEKGALEGYTKNVKKQLEGYEKEVEILEERLKNKREKLNLKFAKMEGKLGTLKSEQNYLTSQLAKLG